MREELPGNEIMEIFSANLTQRTVTQRTQTNGVLIYEDQDIIIINDPKLHPVQFTCQTFDYAYRIFLLWLSRKADLWLKILRLQ